MRKKLRKIFVLIFIIQIIISIFSIKSFALIETNTETGIKSDTEFETGSDVKNLYVTNFGSSNLHNTYNSNISDRENDEDSEDSNYASFSNDATNEKNESYDKILNEANSLKGYSSNGYFLNLYDVKIDVNEDNSYNITETIEAFFSNSKNKHGIIRKIPLENTVRRRDGTSETNRASITNISVNDSHSILALSDECDIRIGDSDRTVSGLKQYVIKYKYNIGNDKNKNFDELYFNIIGNNWDTSIKNVTFTINMPKEFDASKVGFSSGSYGEISADDKADNGGIAFNIKENTITGFYAGNSGILNPLEGITVRIELPQGYFIEQKLHTTFFTFFDAISFILPMIFIVIVTMFWNKYGKGTKPVETVEFYPPEGLNSLDVGYFYDGKVKNNHVISLLVYLANKGYIEIKEIEKSGLFTKKHTYQINKIKEYDGDNSTEKIFFEGLFDCGSNGIVKEEDLVDKFYKTIAKVSEKEEKVHEEELHTKKSRKATTIMKIMLIINMIIIAVTSIECLLNLFLSSFQEYTLDLTKMVCNSIISLIIMIMITKIASTRTEYGTKILGKIKGFRNFLETAEKDKLEKLVKEDPKYFYNILPYTYSLGISKIWMDKFETMAIQTEPPTWYSGHDDFNMVRFNTFMNNTMESETTAMTSSPSRNVSDEGKATRSNENSGGYTGGGFSGGGSGGGGGSSW